MKIFALKTLVLGAALALSACGEAQTDEPTDATQDHSPTGSGDTGGGDSDTGGDPAVGGDTAAGADSSSGGDAMSGADTDAGGDSTAAPMCNGVPVADACLAVHCENELQVGRPCTKNGGECGDFSLSNAWLCTVDAYETDLAFCTKICSSSADCGSNAVCGGDPSNPGAGSGCVPAACNQ